MAEFSINTKQIKRYELDLLRFAAKAYPFATKFTINGAAADSMRRGRKRVERDMILRNSFTKRSIQFETTRSNTVSRQQSTVGSIAPYMADQEFGGVKTKEGKEGTPIPTSFAAGLPIKAQPRTKLPRKPNKLQNISLKRSKTRGKSKRQRLLVRVIQAVETGNRKIFLRSGNGKKAGIYHVEGGRKRGRWKGGGWPVGAKLRMVYDLSNKSVIIPKSPWLKPSVAATTKVMPRMYRDALVFQLKRHGLFKSR